MNWLALDIGGANIKAADGAGYAQSIEFPLWQQPEKLSEALRSLLMAAPPRDRLAVTMTGELADCFSTKAEGVAAIIAAAQSAAGETPLSIYRSDGRLVPPAKALQSPLHVAAVNWHALASFACRLLKSSAGMLIDIGSTTSDIIPLTKRGPVAEGICDPDRLMLGELVYTGVVRSPVCAVTGVLPWRGSPCPTAAEVFATTADAYLILGDLPEDESATYTADGRAMTRSFAHDRLARSICADRDLFDEADARAAADAIERAQLAKLGVAACRVSERLGEPVETMILGGQGEFLARRLLKRLSWTADVVSLAEEFGERVSRCAPAHALAVLAREHAQ
ncbi:MAG: hydantoinase/oxoprolinase family protein [Pirellulales bacterium]